MPTLRLVVRYNGTRFAGWQRQRGVITIQSELERAVEEMSGAPARVHGAGRTDAGVHARGQVAAFTTERSIPMRGWLFGLNRLLPPEIAVHEVREVPDGYDPRRASGGKRYRYLIRNSPVRDPFLMDRCWVVHEPLDISLMQDAAQRFVGSHDFAAFRAADCERPSTVRTLFRVSVVPRAQLDDALIAIEVEGTAFLKNMVRILSGTLVDVGRGRLTPDVVTQALEHGDRTRVGMTAPAAGLTLDQVFVRPEHRLVDDSLPLPPIAIAPVETGRENEIDDEG